MSAADIPRDETIEKRVLMARILKEFTGEAQFVNPYPALALGVGLVLLVVDVIVAIVLGIYLSAHSYRPDSIIMVEWVVFGCFVVSIGLIGIWLKDFRRNAFGRAGEKKVAGILNELPDSFVVLHSLVLPHSKGTFEIDHLVLTDKRGYVLETKAWLGRLTGDPQGKRWTQSKWSSSGNQYSKSLSNPIKQNAFHIHNLRRWLDDQPVDSPAAKARRYWLENLVVLTGSPSLSDALFRAKQLCNTENLGQRLLQQDSQGQPTEVKPEHLGTYIAGIAAAYNGKHIPKG